MNEALMEKYGSRLLRSACLLCGSASEAQDLVQETFLQLISGRAVFRGESSPFTWLYAIMRNQYFKQYRRRWWLQIMPDLPERPSEVHDPLSPLAAQESRRDLIRAVRKLPFKQREVLVLRYVEELKLEEIGQALQLPVGTVKSRLNKAGKVLRRNMTSRRGCAPLPAREEANGM